MEETKMNVWDFVPEFSEALTKHLQEKDEPRWADTWLKRTRKGQEQRTINNFTDKFDKFLNAGQPIDWLALAGDVLICYTRENHEEIWKE